MGDNSYILRSNDEYALVLCGATAILRLGDFGDKFHLLLRTGKIKRPEGEELPYVLEIPKLIDMLVSGDNGSKFLKLFWGGDWNWPERSVRAYAGSRSSY